MRGVTSVDAERLEMRESGYKSHRPLSWGGGRIPGLVKIQIDEVEITGTEEECEFLPHWGGSDGFTSSLQPGYALHATGSTCETRC